MIIAHVNRLGIEWASIRRALDAAIADAHEMLERTGLDMEATEFHRGKIAAWKELIEAIEPRPVPEASVVNYG